jgi:hypothetical protein
MIEPFDVGSITSFAAYVSLRVSCKKSTTLDVLTWKPLMQSLPIGHQFITVQRTDQTRLKLPGTIGMACAADDIRMDSYFTQGFQ